MVMKFGQKTTISEKAAMVENRLGKTTGAAKDTKPAPKAKITVRPTGGLKPSGVKIKFTKQFSSGKWVK